MLLAGAVLTLVLMFGGNLVIWDFQVSGNDTVPTETILRALEDYGITVGSPGLHIDQETMRNHVQHTQMEKHRSTRQLGTSRI